MSSNMPPPASEKKETIEVVHSSAKSLNGATLFLCVLFSVGCLGVALWSWYDVQSRLVVFRTEVADQVIANKSQSAENAQAVTALENQLNVLQAQTDRSTAWHEEIQLQYTALQEMYQDVVAQEDRRLLGDVEHLLMVASQQLQLTGDVQGAIRTMETADAMLATSDKQARYLALRKAIAADLEALKSVDEVDINGAIVKVDVLIGGIGDLPFAAETARVIQTDDLPPEAPDHRPAWRILLSDVWSQLKQLVTIRHLDKPDSALLSPDQAFFIRENLKLRLLAVRISLLTRNDTVYHQDLQAALEILNRYFDITHKRGQLMVETIQKLNENQLATPLPSLERSYQAFKQLSGLKGVLSSSIILPITESKTVQTQPAEAQPVNPEAITQAQPAVSAKGETGQGQPTSDKAVSGAGNGVRKP